MMCDGYSWVVVGAVPFLKDVPFQILGDRLGPGISLFSEKGCCSPEFSSLEGIACS